MRHRSIDQLDRGNRVRGDLARIRKYHEAALDGPRGTDESGIRGSSAGEPVHLDAVQERADTINDLHFWCRFILDEVNGGTITTRVSPTLEDMSAFVARWYDLLREQHPGDADNLDAEMHGHAWRLECLARGWRTQRIQVGKCPEQTVTGQPGQETLTACTGNLWSIVRVQDVLLPEVIRCDSVEEHQWRPWQWAALGRRLQICGDVAV